MTVDNLDTALAARLPLLHRELLEASVDPDDVAAWVRRRLPLTSDHELAIVLTRLRQRLHGLGPLDRLLVDPTITEIMVNGPGPVWVEREGRLEASTVTVDADEIRLAIDRIVAPRGLRLDRAVPFVDARLPDGSRVHITVAPMAIDGPYLTIRRFSDEVLPIEAFGDSDVTSRLRRAVEDRANLVVTGATGAGKTSLLAALAQAVPAAERLVVIEDTAELRFDSRHVVRLEARPPNAEGVGELSVRLLVRNALRMRPDRLIVGEVRGAETFDMVQALSTGHAGSLSTCHANSPADALDRLTAMVLMADTPLTESLAERQLRNALDLLVHVGRGPHGTRVVTDIVELGATGLQWVWRSAVATRPEQP